MRKSIKESDYILQFDEFLSLMKKEDVIVKVAKNGYVFFADDETLGNNLLGFINPNTSNQKLHIQVPVHTVASLDEFENTKELVDFIISEYSHYKRKFESKKSTRKSIKESENFVNYIAVYDEDSNCRGYIQNESPRLTQDVGKALHFKNENEANAFCAKLIKHRTFNSDELYVEGMYLNESKKFARKSIKESKTNYLTVEEFCNLCAKVFIHYEIWSFDGHNRYEESYDLSKIKYSPYKNHDVLMWDFDKDVLILYIENNAIPF